VVEDGKLVGLITFEAFRGLPQDRLGTARVGELMLKEVLTAAPADDAMDAFKRLVRGPGDRLVVMDAGKVVGIVTQADFLRAVKLAGG
jgi:CBS domain-containing protein